MRTKVSRHPNNRVLKMMLLMRMMIVAAMKRITVNLKEVVGNCIPALGDFDTRVAKKFESRKQGGSR